MKHRKWIFNLRLNNDLEQFHPTAESATDSPATTTAATNDAKTGCFAERTGREFLFET